MNSNDETVSFVYTVQENTDARYATEIRMESTDITPVICNFDWDKSAERYELVLASDTQMSLTGDITVDGDVTTLTVDNINADGTEIDPGMTVIVDKTAEMPDAPAYTDVLTLSENDIQVIISDLQSGLMSVLSGIDELSWLFG